MKDRLTAIFNTMKEIETKGESTVKMADCLMALAEIINSMPGDEGKEDEICRE